MPHSYVFIIILDQAIYATPFSWCNFCAWEYFKNHFISALVLGSLSCSNFWGLQDAHLCSMQDLQFFICLREWHGLGSVWVEKSCRECKITLVLSHGQLLCVGGWEYSGWEWHFSAILKIMFENFTKFQYSFYAPHTKQCLMYSIKITIKVTIKVSSRVVEKL